MSEENTNVAVEATEVVATPAQFKAVVDAKQRYVTECNHTATHLLHQALREILGKEVKQKGSNINPERLRFDFNFDRKLTDEEKKKIEDWINNQIKKS